MKRIKNNQLLLSLIDLLSKEKKPIWKRTVKELTKPTKNRVEVNLSKIQTYGQEGGTVLIPGKVLGSGVITKKLTIAAFSFSKSAKDLITAVGGKAITIDSLHKSNPTGKGVQILK